MESFLPWKTTVQLRITTDYNLNFRNVGFLLWRTRVIEKAGHQVYSGPKMFWCWSPREENEGFSKYINFCWNIFLLAQTSDSGWFLLQLFAIIINIIWPLYLAQLCCGIQYKYLRRFCAPLWLLLYRDGKREESSSNAWQTLIDMMCCCFRVKLEVLFLTKILSFQIQKLFYIFSTLQEGLCNICYKLDKVDAH